MERNKLRGDEKPKRILNIEDIFRVEPKRLLVSPKIIEEKEKLDKNKLATIEQLQNLLEILNSIDINKIKNLASVLYNRGQELSIFKDVLKNNPNLSSKLNSVIFEKITQGVKAFTELENYFRSTGLLKALEQLSVTAPVGTIGVNWNQLPIQESDLIKTLKLSEYEEDIIKLIFDNIVKGAEVDFELIANKLSVELENITNKEVKIDITQKKKQLVWLSCSIKSFCGFSLIALNASAYIASAGILISLVPAIASMYSGCSMMVDGYREIGLWEIEHDMIGPHYAKAQ